MSTVVQSGQLKRQHEHLGVAGWLGDVLEENSKHLHRMTGWFGDVWSRSMGLVGNRITASRTHDSMSRLRRDSPELGA